MTQCIRQSVSIIISLANWSLRVAMSHAQMNWMYLPGACTQAGTFKWKYIRRIPQQRVSVSLWVSAWQLLSHPLGQIYYYCPTKLLFLQLSRTSDISFVLPKQHFFHFSRTKILFLLILLYKPPHKTLFLTIGKSQFSDIAKTPRTKSGSFLIILMFCSKLRTYRYR